MTKASPLFAVPQYVRCRNKRETESVCRLLLRLGFESRFDLHPMDWKRQAEEIRVVHIDPRQIFHDRPPAFYLTDSHTNDVYRSGAELLLAHRKGRTLEPHSIGNVWNPWRIRTTSYDYLSVGCKEASIEEVRRILDGARNAARAKRARALPAFDGWELRATATGTIALRGGWKVTLTQAEELLAAVEKALRRRGPRE